MNDEKKYSDGESETQAAVPNAVERIHGSFDTLTVTEQEAARFILGHLTDVLVCNSAELAELSGVSQPTMSRLYRKLGYANAGEFRRDVRKFHQPGAPELAGVNSVAGSERDGLVSSHMERELAAIRRTFARLDERAVCKAARMLASARKVCVIGFRNGYPVALHLREQLMQLRPDVAALPQPGQSIAEEIVDYDSSDVAILVGVRRRPSLFSGVAQALHEAGVPTIVIGDATVRTALPEGDAMVLEADLSVHVLSSYTAVYAVAALLVDALSDQIASSSRISTDVPSAALSHDSKHSDANTVQQSVDRIEEINRQLLQLGELESSRRTHTSRS